MCFKRAYASCEAQTRSAPPWAASRIHAPRFASRLRCTPYCAFNNTALDLQCPHHFPTLIHPSMSFDSKATPSTSSYATSSELMGSSLISITLAYPHQHSANASFNWMGSMFLTVIDRNYTCKPLQTDSLKKVYM